MRFCLLFILFYFGLSSVFAQEKYVEKMKWLSTAKPTTNLFVHFDKNVYSNNEIVYFTGYIIKEGKFELNQHNIMSVALVRDADSTVIIDDKFVMDNGLSFGSITIPDSVLTGNYHFLAYTDKLVNNLPEELFIQPITLKTNIDPAFKAIMKISTSKADNDQTHKVLVSVTSKDNRFLTKPTQITYKYGKFIKTEKSDLSGQLLMSLPKQANIKDPNVYVKLKYENDSSFISMAIPQLKNKATVKFYPEGGNMVNGLLTTIGWEVKDHQQQPIALKAFFLVNNVVIDTIETSSYGIGKFKLMPRNGSNYTVKLVHSNLADSIYTLPRAIENGLVLNLPNAVAQDTLKVYLKSNEHHHLNILLHNYKEVFANIPFHMDNWSRAIKIPLNETPKGLTTITILDSLGRPLAERIFFAHYDSTQKLNLETDKLIYNQREKVNLKLNLNTFDNALVSIACVQDNRLEIGKMTDILSYSYLKNELNTLPVQIRGNAYQDQDYIAQILMVKGWSRYTWQDLEKLNQNENSFRLDSLSITGSITKNKKELTEPTTIGVFGDEKLRLLTTSNKGVFDFNSSELILPQGKKTYLFINEKNKFAYKFQIKDSFILMNAQLAKKQYGEELVLPSTLLNNADLVLKGNEKAIRLNEVVIKSRIDNSFKYGRGGPGSNLCGDYVCMYNILNCRNHFGDAGNSQPVEGVIYSGSNGPYHGCKTAPAGDDTFKKFNGIHLQKEFYLDDYKDPQEPAYFSTIYWNYGMLLHKDKISELNFYTSDITGKFRIIIQGITNNDLIYAEKYFEVKPKTLN